MTEAFRVGIDIGGTFTDVVLLDSRTGRLFNEKVLTTPNDPSAVLWRDWRKFSAAMAWNPAACVI